MSWTSGLLLSVNPSTTYICDKSATQSHCVLGVFYFVHFFQRTQLSPLQNTNEEEEEQASRSSHSKPPAGLPRSSNLYRAGSIKDLIIKFSAAKDLNTGSSRSLFSGKHRMKKAASVEALFSRDTPMSTASLSTQCSNGQEKNPAPSITVTPPFQDSSQNGAESPQKDTESSEIPAKTDCPVSNQSTESKPRSKTQTADSGSAADSGLGSVSQKKIPRPNVLMSLHESGHSASFPCEDTPDWRRIAWLKLCSQSAWWHKSYSITNQKDLRRADPELNLMFDAFPFLCLF